MNPDILAMLERSLSEGYQVLVLSNAMRPMMRLDKKLLEIKEKYADQLTIRVSIDHYTKELHEEERGPRSWDVMLKGLKWLSEHHFNLHAAGRYFTDEGEGSFREGYAALFEEQDIAINAHDHSELILFPEMDEEQDVPEITTACWQILSVSPDAMMCASSRMIVKKKDKGYPTVISCTLLPYAEDFDLGRTLKESDKSVYLNHPHCAKFCVLGGASCSG